MSDQNTEVKWFIDENIPGIGDRPAWLPEKYKTVADLARSNAELEKKLGTVPEEYDFSSAKFFEKDHPAFVELRQVAKEKRVAKDVMDKVVSSVDSFVSKFHIDEAAELKKLGDNAEERRTTIDNWSKANLSKDAYEAINKNKTADMIKALEEIRGKIMSQSSQVPTGNTGATDQTSSLSDLQAELSANLEKYSTDAEYRKDYSRRIEQAAKNLPGYIDKMGG